MPRNGVGAASKELSTALVVGTPVHEMNLWITLRGSRRLVDVMSSEISAEFERLVNWQVSKVLVPESLKVLANISFFAGVYDMSYQQPSSEQRRGPVGPFPLLIAD